MPSKREAADRFSVSVVTAEHAYALLCDEGYMTARQRSGCFAAFRAEDGLYRPGPEPAAALFPEAGPPPREAFPFSVLARTYRAVLQDEGERLLLKAPGPGLPALREAIAGYLSRSRGLNVRAGQVIVGSGAEYLYGLIVKLLGRERMYAAENPSYEKIAQVYQAEGVSCDLLRLGPDGIQSPELKRTRASVLHVTPYHSFPSGVTADASKRREYIAWAGAPGRFLVEDDFCSEFSLAAKPRETLYAQAGGEKVLYLNTFSQTIAPSLRVGYLVLPDKMAAVYEEKAGFFSCPVPTLEQAVLTRLILGGDLERHINRVRRKRRAEARQL